MSDTQTVIRPDTKGVGILIQKLRHGGLLGLITVLLVVVVATSLLSDAFLTPNNLINVLRQVAVIAVIAAGLTLLMTSGGIDFSMASNAAVTTGIIAQLVTSGVSTGAAVLTGLAVSTLIGLFNGVIITLFGVAPFVVTLATATLLDGLALLVINGMSISAGDALSAFGTGSVAGIPYVLICAVIVCVSIGAAMKYTAFGRQAFAMGGNEDVARLSGIAVTRNKLFLYSLNGLLAGIAGLLLVSRVGAASPGNAGLTLELTAVAAVVIGGTSLAGGKGSMVGTALGVLLLGVVSNALNLLGVSSYYQAMSVGVVLLIASIANAGPLSRMLRR